MTELVLYPGTERERRISLSQQSIVIGRATDADVRLDSKTVSGHHARIENRPDGYYVIDLDSTNGVAVNDSPISFERLHHGDTITFDQEVAQFLDPSAPAEPNVLPAAEDAAIVDEGADELQTVSSTPSALTVIPSRAAGERCPACDSALAPGAPNCLNCGQVVSHLPAAHSGYIPPDQTAGKSGMGILPIIGFLAGVSIVGFPIAIALGLLTHASIKQRGGTLRDRNMANWALGLGMLWLMLAIVTTTFISWRKSESKKKQAAMEQLAKAEETRIALIEENESRVIRALKSLACAQKYAFSVELLDIDNDGTGEYADLAALQESRSPFFDSNLADGEAFGYRFEVRDSTEGRFLAVAEPLEYQKTGSRTFAIDQTGLIRGVDAEGKRHSQLSFVLPTLQGERSAYYEVDDEIAKDVLNYSKGLSQSVPDQEKVIRIIRRLKSEFALTTVGQELEGISSSADKFVTEKHAEALYREAKTAIEAATFDVALAKLQLIENEYSGFSKIADVERKLAEVRGRILEQNEERAGLLLAEAEVLERDGKQEEARKLYQQIEIQYPYTDVAERISELKPELQRVVLEKKAEAIFFELMELSPAQDYDTLLNLATKLRKDCEDTDIYQDNEYVIENQERKARAIRWRIQTEEKMKQGQLRGALAQLETAAIENPDLKSDLSDLFAELYRSVGAKLREESDYREALEMYINLQNLPRELGSREEIDPAIMAELYNKVGQADLLRKQYEAARIKLSNAAWNYSDDSLFNYRLGIANLYTGNFEESSDAFGRAIRHAPDMEEARLYRSYLNIRFAGVFEQMLAEGFMKKYELKVTLEEHEDDKKKEDDDDDDKDKDDEEDDEDDDDEDGDDKKDEEEEEKRLSIDIEFPDIAQLNFREKFKDYSEHRVPPPKQIRARLSYNYASSRKLLNDMIAIVSILQEAQFRFADELRDARGQGRGSIDTARMKQYLEVSEYKNQLSGLRTRHLDDIKARQELVDVLNELEQRLSTVHADLSAVAKTNRRIETIAKLPLSQLVRKIKSLRKGIKTRDVSMEGELQIGEQILKAADEALGYLQKDSLSVSTKTKTVRDIIRKMENSTDFDSAVLAIKESIDEEIDLEDILRAAEGNTRVSGDF